MQKYNISAIRSTGKPWSDADPLMQEGGYEEGIGLDIMAASHLQHIHNEGYLQGVSKAGVAKLDALKNEGWTLYYNHGRLLGWTTRPNMYA